MKKIIGCATLLLVLATQSASAQKVKLKEGSLSALAGVSKMNVQYDYSSMGVGKFDTEAEYISKKKEDYNKDESGKGDKWETAWVADRESRFEPQFEELFDKHSDGIDIGKNGSEKYTLIVKTTFTEPGFNVHVMRKNAMINAEILVVETANPSNVLATLTVDKSPGRTFGGYDYDSGTRIQEAYAAAGKALGKFISKERK